MALHVDDLPDEVLLRILDLLPQRDLINAVPYVSSRWRRLSVDFQLWRRRTCSEVWDTDASAVRFFTLGPALAAVSFQRCVGGAVLRCMGQNCASITTLHLQGAQRFSLRTLRAITRGCVHVRHLNVNSAVLSCRRRAREVALMPRLETLAVFGCEPMQLRELAAGCATLRRLELDVAEVRLADLGAPLLSRLHGLVVTWGSASRDIGLCAPSLSELTLDYYDDSTRPDADALRSLTALTLVDARCLGEREGLVLRALLQPRLRVLSLHRCASLDDSALLQLCRHCPLLEDLDVSHCDHVTARGLGALWRLRSLRRLCLMGCEGLGSGAVTHLARCVGLQDLNLDDVDLERLEPGVSRLLELRKMSFLVLRAWTARDSIPWESLPKAYPDLKVLELGEWMSLDSTLPESLKAALPAVRVAWYYNWELFEGRDSESEEAAGNLTEPEEPDLDLFIFCER